MYSIFSCSLFSIYRLVGKERKKGFPKTVKNQERRILFYLCYVPVWSVSYDVMSYSDVKLVHFIKIPLLCFAVGYTNSNHYATGRENGGGGGGTRPPVASDSWSKIEWFYIPAGLGFALIGFLQLKHIWKREQKKHDKVSDVNNNSSVEERRFIFKAWQVNLKSSLV